VRREMEAAFCAPRAAAERREAEALAK